MAASHTHSGWVVIAKDPASIGVKYLCRPPGAQVDGLKQMDLELLRVGESADELTETGVVAVIAST